MATATTSPEPTQGEPHPAVRLAEVVCALIAAIVGPSWFWRFLPGGRAFRASMEKLSRDFAALMQRLASLPPAPLPAPAQITATPRPRATRPAAKPRPRRISAPRRARTPPAVANRPRHIPTHASIVVAPGAAPRVGIAIRKRRRRNGGFCACPKHALYVAKSKHTFNRK